METLPFLTDEEAIASMLVGTTLLHDGELTELPEGNRELTLNWRRHSTTGSVVTEIEIIRDGMEIVHS